MRYPKVDRYDHVRELLWSTPDCYYTHHQISQYLRLKTTPYTRQILLDLVDNDPSIHRVEVTAVNGRMAWGYYYSPNIHQLTMDIEACL